MSYLSDLLGDSYKEGMTEEEISVALETVGRNRKAEIDKLKNALSNANSEAADYRRKLRDKQSDDERTAEEQKKAHEQLVQENTELKKTISISEKKAKLISMGQDENLADETATAMVNGDMDTVIVNQNKYIEAQKKIIQADHMRNTPRPKYGSNQTENMDYRKMIADAQANGNISAVAYYTRLEAQDEINTINNI